MAARIAYILFIFPVLSETTVVNELCALERLGATIRVLSWEAPEGKDFYTITPHVQHGITARWVARTSYMLAERRGWPAVMAANLRVLAHRGLRRYYQAYRLAHGYRMIGPWRSFARLIVPWAADLLRDRTTRLHAHFATEATAVAHVLSVLTGIPFSFTAHAHDIYSSLYQTPDKLGRKLQAADFAVTVCQANRRYMLEHCPDVPPAKIRVKRPGVDLRVFQPPDAARESGCPRIVSIGRLVETKGFADLIQACALLRQQGHGFDCHIVGEGPCRGELQAAIKRLDLGSLVHLSGALPREQVLQELDQADLFVLPCFIDPATGDRDGMPLVLAEAMAKGLPVVATPISGIPELVRDGAGLIVPPRDAAALAAGLAAVLGLAPCHRRAMGRRGRAIVEAEFDESRESARLLDWFGRGTT